ncbi:MAG: phosphoglycerate mutase [Nitrospira sp.]|nr:phosphoglycerate mutase [Nitrospira sp.]
MKYLILHAGGLAGHAQDALGGRTPLQAAATPHLDRLARLGELGLVAIPTEENRHGSGLNGTAILGYDPKKYYQGPGLLEAASLGVSVTEQDVVYRCTMVTVKPEGGKVGADIKKLSAHVVLDDATAGLIDTDEARELIEAINEQLGSETMQFYPGMGHRHVMVWVNGKPRAVCQDPQSVRGRLVGDALPTGDGANILRELMEASHLILRDHPVNADRLASGKNPANCIWLWGEGRAIPWPSLAERFQVTGAVVASSAVHRGVGLCAGLDAADFAEGDDEPFQAMATTVLDEFAQKDFVYVYASLSDEVVHGSDVNATVQAIEAFDRDLVGPILEGLAKTGPYRFLVLCDHGEGVQGQAFAVFGDGPGKGGAAGGRRFTESDAQASEAPVRDASKFAIKLFAKG